MRTTFVSVMAIFFSKVMFKVFSQQLHSTLTMTFERHLTIENFTEMD